MSQPDAEPQNPGQLPAFENTDAAGEKRRNENKSGDNEELRPPHIDYLPPTQGEEE